MTADDTSTAVSPAGAQSAIVWRGLFSSVLLLTMAVGATGLFAIGALAPFLRSELGISRLQLGSLSSLYFLSAMTLSGVAGRLVDRFGGRRLMLWLFAVVAAGAILPAVVPTYPGLVAAVPLMGAGLAASNPATNRLVAVHLEPGRQGLAVGIKQSGTYVGALLAGGVLPGVAVAWGWRAAFAVTVLLAIIAAVIAGRVVPQGEPTTERGARSRSPGGVGLASPLVWYAFFIAAGTSAVPAYLALYAHESLGLSTVSAGQVLALLGAVGVLARVVWGPAAERLRTTSGPLTLAAAAAVVSQLAVASSGRIGLWMLLVGVVGLSATALAFTVIAMVGVVRNGSREDAGRDSGRVLSAFFGGMLVGPLAFGTLVDLTGDYAAGWHYNTIMFACALTIGVAWHFGGWAWPADR